MKVVADDWNGERRGRRGGGGMGRRREGRGRGRERKEKEEEGMLVMRMPWNGLVQSFL